MFYSLIKRLIVKFKRVKVKVHSVILTQIRCPSTALGGQYKGVTIATGQPTEAQKYYAKHHG